MRRVCLLESLIACWSPKVTFVIARLEWSRVADSLSYLVYGSMISRSSGERLASLLRDASSTPTWCRVRHWWAMIGDPGKPGLDP
ncbi:hypothetical protein Hanom_Chr15g01343041 [Helianthus anomalus]